MNKKHLWWIFPVIFIVGLVIGAKAGFDIAYESFETFGEWSCEVGLAGLELCFGIVEYMINYNGTTEEAIKQYGVDNNETIQSLMQFVGVMNE